MTDAERANIALGTGPRAKLDPADGEKLSGLIKREITDEIERLKDGKDLTIDAENEWQLLMSTCDITV